jgi:ABC-type thiamin/hydroxymethylpyrimidine transport system permease subunit
MKSNLSNIIIATLLGISFSNMYPVWCGMIAGVAAYLQLSFGIVLKIEHLPGGKK